MSTNRKMDNESIVHRHNGIVFSYNEKLYHEICRKMDVPRKHNINEGYKITERQKRSHVQFPAYYIYTGVYI